MTSTTDRGYPWQFSTPALPTRSMRVAEPAWAIRYSRIVTLSDLAVVLFATGSTHLLWFGLAEVTVSTPSFVLTYVSFSSLLVVAWMTALAIAGSRDAHMLGTDTTEYRRVVNATLALFGAIAVFATMTQTELARGYLLTAFPLGLVLLVGSRWGWRQWLNRQRARGEFSFRVLIVGNAASVTELAASLAERPQAGYRVVDALVTDSPPATLPELPGISVQRTTPGTMFGQVAGSVSDTVVVVGSDEVSSASINELSWRLDPGQRLVVAPQLVGVAGSRIHTRPVAGLPLIHVETPSYDGAKRVAKRTLDIVGSALLLIALAPLFLITAVLIKLASPGPVFYGQERIGLSGEPFTILKFRSMRIGADRELAALLAAEGTDDRPLFKPRSDPRITPIGRILRRYSIDELPQLLNVLRGDMSLVGPRPQVDGEVRLYDSKSSRRLAVKPGMTGLWQVSGRSNLSWENAIRLDLYYVENWSITSDLVILLRTVRAVFAHDGAV
jgi:exopolysaccharide biosynthesis polyprenyl glycosylphosphotransferase